MLSDVCTETVFFFVNNTATTEIYTLSLHDALPICCSWMAVKTVGTSLPPAVGSNPPGTTAPGSALRTAANRSEEHTSELQSQSNLVCRLLLEKKNGRRKPGRGGPSRPGDSRSSRPT